MKATSGLRVFALGGFRAEDTHGRTLDFRSDSERALLVYLATEAGKAHSRESLGALLWPGSSEQAARSNLRVALHRLRQALGVAGESALRVSTKQIDLGGEHIESDVVLFVDAQRRLEQHKHVPAQPCSQCLRDLNLLVELYRGEFLQGFPLSGSREFLEWKTMRQEYFHRSALQAHSRLAEFHIAKGELSAAEAHARRQLELEPWREVAHRQLMLILFEKGEREAALAQFDTCRRVLAEELAVEPADATKELLERIRAGTQTTQSAAAASPTILGRRIHRKWGIAAGLLGLAAVLLMFSGVINVGPGRGAVYDDFQNTEFDGAYDPSLWINPLNESVRCAFVQQDGVLRILPDPQLDQSGCTLRVRQPLSAAAGALAFRAKMLISDSHNGGPLASELRAVAGLPAGDWTISCGVHATQTSLVVQFDVLDGSRGSAYDESMVFTASHAAHYGKWVEVTLVISENRAACEADGAIVGEYALSSALAAGGGALFYREIGAWWLADADGELALDDVVVISAR